MITLGYWNVRGLGSALRILLHYVGADFEEVIYDIDRENDKWFKEVKPTMGAEFAFPNLPYIIDDKVKLTQVWSLLYNQRII